MTHPTTPYFEPTTEDFRLIEETIRRVSKTMPIAEQHRFKVKATLIGEVGRGRRDLFSLVRAARKALDEA